MRNLLKRQNEKGFTLIEIVIVLAIAGLIFVIIFIAIGSAQRSRRDQQRRDTVGQYFAAIDQYASNNNGGIPTTNAFLTTYSSSLKDPDTGNAPLWNTATNTATSTSGIVAGNGQICALSGGNPTGDKTTTGATNRNYAAIYWSEGGNASQCKDNR